MGSGDDGAIARERVYNPVPTGHGDEPHRFEPLDLAGSVTHTDGPPAPSTPRGPGSQETNAPAPALVTLGNLYRNNEEFAPAAAELNAKYTALKNYLKDFSRL